MKTLVEIAKQADKLYNEFLKEQEELLPQQLKTMNSGITEEEQNKILEWIHEHDYMDTDEYDAPEDCEYYGSTGHWDEQAYYEYAYDKDEDGNWVHPIDIEIN